MVLAAGTRLGPYEILALLGAGGMGEVYKARDTRLDRTVAIKVLSPTLAADPHFRERFDREARVISQLDHPHICALYDVGEHDGAAFLVMQYLEGETLGARLTKGPLPMDEGLTLAMQIASALDSAHRAHVVHRDLKPGNVMLTAPGARSGSPPAFRQGLPQAASPGSTGSARPGSLHATLLDFGLAKLVDPASAVMDAQTITDPRTAFGVVVGTTRYMSPEQARGLPIDARSDLFSFGVLLYEMLAGRAPFEASTATDTIVAILEREPVPLIRHREETPPELQRIVSKCLQKDVAHRYATAGELAVDLERVKAAGSGPHVTTKPSPSIAVLPFVNMSADPENEYFCDGIAEDLINALTKVEQLRVAARTSAFSFKGKGATLQEVARTLNVNTVLEGSVRKAGNRLRVTAQIVNVADGYQLWSERYDRQLEDVFEIQDEISSAIVKALKVKLLGEENAVLVKRPTDNIEAYQLYLKGRHHWHKWNPDGFAKSKECMERAIALDPDYALAFFGLADVYLASGAIGLIPYSELLPKAKSALKRALDLDSDLAEAWTLMGVVHFFEWEWAASDHASTRALELNPRLGHAHLVRALNNLYAGRPEAGLAAAKRAVELDPLAQLWNFALVLAYIARGDEDAALSQTYALLDIDPSFWWAHYCRGVLAIARGEYGEASQYFSDAVRGSGGAPYAVGLLACALARAGEHDRAEAELAGLIEHATERHVPAVSVALAYVGLGKDDHAFEWLERSFKERDIWLIVELLYLPHLKALRNDSRMIDLRRRIAQCGVRLDVE
jgi:serine/threonine-protein kinase